MRKGFSQISDAVLLLSKYFGLRYTHAAKVLEKIKSQYYDKPFLS
jgi:hypothetical protein